MSKSRGSGFIDFGNLDDDDFFDDKYMGSHSGKVYIPQGKSCHETHEPLHIGGGTLIGGNCNKHERHKKVHLYVALDSYQSHPLFDGLEPARCCYYPITNMKVPANPEKFRLLIDMIVDELAQGRTVHVGCIGGHGRTGLVIGAVVARLGIAEDNDAIGWVRTKYCNRAIETAGQENFLVVHYGVKMPAKKLVDKFKSGR